MRPAAWKEARGASPGAGLTESATSAGSRPAPGAPGALAVAECGKHHLLNPDEELHLSCFILTAALQQDDKDSGHFLSTEALFQGPREFKAFHLHSNPARWVLLPPHFTDEETEAQGHAARTR